MNSYAWKKFHLATEMLRDGGDIRENLAQAFSQEIGQIKDVDIPNAFAERIGNLFAAMSLPENVESITGMGSVHLRIRNMSDAEIEWVVQEIFRLESILKTVSC